MKKYHFFLGWIGGALTARCVHFSHARWDGALREVLLVGVIYFVCRLLLMFLP